MESNTNNNLNYQMNKFYQKILEIFKKEDQKPSLIYHLIESLEGTIQWCAGYAKTDYEKEVIRNCEIDAIKYYQNSLEYNYEKIKQYKENQDESDKYFMFLTMTFDKEGNPRKVKVIDVIKGKPIFEDGCTLVEIWREINKVSGYKTKLAKWIDKNGTLKETLNEALILQLH